jgi:hypothetical protein
VDADEAGRLLAGLCDLTVRDVAVALLTGWGRQASDVDQDPRAGSGLTEGGGSTSMSRLDALIAELDPDEALDRLTRRGSEPVVERLWLDLATSADGPLALAPLTAFGLHVWSHGNGALAAAAVERALALDPGYRLAMLLDQALVIGVRPPLLDDDTYDDTDECPDEEVSPFET